MIDLFAGDSRDARGYWFWCALWIGECRRLLAPGGVMAVFTDWRQLPTTTDALQAGGLVWRGIVPWHKPSGRPTQGRFSNTCEYVVWGTNGARELDGSPLPGFFSVNAPRERLHITQKPVSVCRELVKIAPTGGVVLDPFAGAGTVGVAALAEGRRFVGVEILEQFCAATVERLQGGRGAPPGMAGQASMDLAATEPGESPEAAP
jgi:site-specific DNA-methyltransferase (adenine-specific)